jgi:hypothetical protein
MILIQLHSVNSVEMTMADERTATFLQIVTPKLQAYCKASTFNRNAFYNTFIPNFCTEDEFFQIF